MMHHPLLLCTDLDRTMIPNGIQPDFPESRQYFSQWCRSEAVCLVYVTGRHKTLVEEAIASYHLPMPDYAITDVGTKIYKITDGHWQNWSDWEDEISGDWNGWDNAGIRRLLAPFSALKAQEEAKQNTYKVSYYVSPDENVNELLEQVGANLAENGIKASLVWSVDETQDIGLLDILPSEATKLHGIRFLRERLGFPKHKVFFAGDSGNDLPVLASDILSVLVANATEEVKQQAVNLAKQNGHASTLYLAKKQGRRNGNYVDGILQGLEYFEFCNNMDDVKSDSKDGD
jgi:HAD-superfamily hydrolase, subfamily IIB